MRTSEQLGAREGTSQWRGGWREGPAQVVEFSGWSTGVGGSDRQAGEGAGLWCCGPGGSETARP